MHEYKVVPAPLRAVKSKGLKTTADRFAQTLSERINAEAAGGWHFVRTETLPCEERSRLGSAKITTQVVMIFARELGAPRPDAGAALAAAQQGSAAPMPPRPAAPPMPEVAPAPVAAPAPEPAAPVRRQEPLFRSGAMLRAEGMTRPEPVLRPRSAAEDDEQG